MTEKLYYQDAYETAFRAKVLDCQKEKEHFTLREADSPLTMGRWAARQCWTYMKRTA